VRRVELGVKKLHYFPQCDVCMRNDLRATVTGITVDRNSWLFRKDPNVPQALALLKAPTGEFRRLPRLRSKKGKVMGGRSGNGGRFSSLALWRMDTPATITVQCYRCTQ